MRPEVGRRAFVGTVAAGLPLIAASGTRTLAQSGGGHDHGVAHAAHDAVVDHVTRQLATIFNTVRQQGLKGEHARAFAAQLRTLQVYRTHRQSDATLRQRVAASLDERGRDALLYPEADRAAIVRELKPYGLTLEATALPDISGMDYPTRVRALDGVLQHGLSQLLETAATACERGAAHLDARVGRVGIFVNSRRDFGYCEALGNYVQYLYWSTTFMCALTGLVPTVAPECLLLALVTIGLDAWYLYFC